MTTKALVRGLVLAVIALSILSTGCLGNIQKAAQRAKDSNDLKQLGLMYHNYLDSNNKAPANIDDMAKMAQDPSELQVISAVKSGKYILIFGVKVTEMTQGSGSTVLGYDASVPTAGGLVLMGDGSVRQMTAKEFADAPKATPNPAKAP